MSRLRRSIAEHVERLRDDAPVTSALPGGILLAVIALVMLAAIAGHIPLVGGEHGRLVRAQFAAANQVNDRTPVRLAGVDVGHVESVTRGTSPGTATVTMRIHNPDVTVHRDARADIRWRTILGGNLYIDLQPGSPSAPPLGTDAIPVGRTSSQAELDDVTQIFAGSTEDAARVMLRNLRHGLGDPAGTGRALQTFGPAMRAIGRGLKPLRGREEDDLRRIVAATARTLAGAGSDPTQLRRLVEGADRTLSVTDARRSDVRELIERAPAALVSTRTTMTRLRTTLGHLDPLVSRLRIAAPTIAPAAQAATPTLRRLRVLLHDARPLLRAAGPTLAAARRAGLNGAPLLRALEPTVHRLNTDLLPFLERRDGGTRLRTYQAIGPFVSALDSAAAEFNDAGHIVQFPLLPGPNSALPLSQAPAGDARLERVCRQRAQGSARRDCPTAARLLTRIIGRTR